MVDSRLRGNDGRGAGLTVGAQELWLGGGNDGGGGGTGDGMEEPELGRRSYRGGGGISGGFWRGGLGSWRPLSVSWPNGGRRPFRGWRGWP